MKILEIIWCTWIIISTFYMIASGLTLGLLAILPMHYFYVNYPNHISIPAITILILSLLTGIAVV